MTTNLGDRSVIITGAGGGLGRSHAACIAKLGGLITVSDIDQQAADKVVAEITKHGGQAIACVGSITDDEHRQELIEVTIDAYGCLDVIVNNAGVTRDNAFHKMPAEDIDLVLDIHLKSAVHLLRLAWPLLKQRPAARIINTASDSGLHGNFGQANYGAAKMGLVGLTRALADEGRSKSIGVNAIVPVALTAMTEELFGTFNITSDQLGPQWVSPLVAYLASAECQQSGGIWNCAGGIISVTRIVETLGKKFTLAELTPDAIAGSLDEITDPAGQWAPVNMNDKVMGQEGGKHNLFAALAAE